MSLSPGTKLGHYDVTALIGEGGMGEVWQATDTQLNRQVALKILPDAFASDPDRLTRFQREAQVLASLNHPGIAAIYGIEHSDEALALSYSLPVGREGTSTCTRREQMVRVWKSRCWPPPRTTLRGAGLGAGRSCST